MKTNKEIKEYLEPYTKMEGFYTKNLVTVQKVRGRIMDYLCVWFDVKGSWRGIGGTDTRHLSLKKHLTNNGFYYNEREGLYQRPYKHIGVKIKVPDDLFYDYESVYRREYLR